MSGCVFCKIVKGGLTSEKIWENKDFFAFLDANPVNLGHTLLIPKNHVDYIFDLEEPLYSEIFKISKRLSGSLKKATKAKRIGIAVEGFSVPHTHIHLIPLNGANELDPCRAVKATQEELSKIAVKIRKQIKA